MRAEMQIEIRIGKGDGTEGMYFVGPDAPNKAVAKLAHPPEGLDYIRLFDGQHWHYMTPAEALSHLADVYWLQQAG